MKTKLFTLYILLLASQLWAQQSPYAGQQQRPLKALSADEQQQLRLGAGMGLARVAELNGYPGPKHVLELGDQLQLSASQRASVRASYVRMQEAASALGQQIIDAEAQLEQYYQQGTVAENVLQPLVLQLGALRGQLRWVHLRAHTEMKNILTDAQIALYKQLRGYANPDPNHPSAHH